MKAEDPLRAQDWTAITKQLAGFAYRHTGKRSWENAEDLAQQAIADLFTRGGWEPEKEALIAHLCRRVYGLASNARHHRRSSFEVAMRAAVKAHGASHDGGKRELDAPSGADPADDVLDRQRIAASYRKRLAEHIAGDEAVALVLAVVEEGSDSRESQAAATGLTVAQVGDARRRLFRHAANVSKELARELDSEEENEVTP